MRCWCFILTQSKINVLVSLIYLFLHLNMHEKNKIYLIFLNLITLLIQFIRDFIKPESVFRVSMGSLFAIRLNAPCALCWYANRAGNLNNLINE